MEAMRMRKSMFGSLLFALLTVGMFSSTASANFITKRRLAIAVPFTAVLLCCSENARNLSKKAYLKSKIVALRALRECSLTESMGKKCTDMIEDAESDYTTRSSSEFTGENLKALLKEFKELWDATKAAKELVLWMD